MEILAVGAELYHADGRTDGRTQGQLIMPLRNFGKATKIYVLISVLRTEIYINFGGEL